MDANAARFLLYARRLTRTPQDAEDVTQEATIECWRRKNGATPEAALVFKTIRRRAMDLGRREDRRNQREKLTMFEADWFESDILEDESIQIALQALDTLRPEFSEALTLHLWGGLTFREVGEALGISPNTAASRYRYAIEELRKRVGKAIR